MGSSARKKKDKKKDFQKVKLKVGKARPKPSNFTDTSFNAKSIVINQQSLSSVAPSAWSQFSHHVGLLTSRSDAQRRDSLNYLTSAMTRRVQAAQMQQPVAILLPKLLPLTLDGNNGVRTQLLKLFRTLPVEDVKDHMESLTLYIRAGLTHLAADIRTSALEILNWALEADSEQLVACPGGWVKTLKTLLTVLAWTDDATLAGWTSSRAIIGRTHSGDKSIARALNMLALFLQAGLEMPKEPDSTTRMPVAFPLWHTECHMLPRRSNAYAYLDLFGKSKDKEEEAYEDREERQRVFAAFFQGKVRKGAVAARKEGGEIGRAAAMLLNMLEDSKSA